MNAGQSLPEAVLASAFCQPVPLSGDWICNSDSNRVSAAGGAPGESSTRFTGRKSTYRIIIADDHEAVRRGLRSALIGAGWVVCGEAANGREAVEKTTQLKPDLVILDVSMPMMNGLEAAREILDSGSKAKVLVFTMHESEQMRKEAVRLGVHGYAAKSAPLSNILKEIRSILGE